MYYHGEEIGVNVHIANSSSRTCRKIKVTSKSTEKYQNLKKLFLRCFFDVELFVSRVENSNISFNCKTLENVIDCLISVEVGSDLFC